MTEGAATSRGRTVRSRSGPPDEREVFRRRSEWFRRWRTDGNGQVPLDGLARAIAHAGALRLARLDHDPGGSAPTELGEIVGDETHAMRLRPAQNPHPRSSFGFASRPVVVEAADGHTGVPDQVRLKVRLEKQAGELVEVESVRMFR